MRRSPGAAQSGQWSVAHRPRLRKARPAGHAQLRGADECSEQSAPAQPSDAERPEPPTRGAPFSARSRRKCRLPSCSTRPSSSPAGDVERRPPPSVSPSSFTPPCASVRRASDRDRAERLGDHRREVHGRRPAATTRLLDLRRAASCATNTRSKAASASAAAAVAVERATSARASARLASRGPSARRAARAQQQRVPRPDLLVRDLHRLAVHLARRIRDADVVAERLGHLLARRRPR